MRRFFAVLVLLCQEMNGVAGGCIEKPLSRLHHMRRIARVRPEVNEGADEDVPQAVLDPQIVVCVIHSKEEEDRGQKKRDSAVQARPPLQARPHATHDEHHQISAAEEDNRVHCVCEIPRLKTLGNDHDAEWHHPTHENPDGADELERHSEEGDHARDREDVVCSVPVAFRPPKEVRSVESIRIVPFQRLESVVRDGRHHGREPDESIQWQPHLPTAENAKEEHHVGGPGGEKLSLELPLLLQERIASSRGETELSI